MDKYVIAPPEGSTNNSVGAADRHWGKGYFDELPGYNEYLAESTGYGIVSGCEPSISGLTVTVGAGVVHLADGTRKEISASSVTLDAADSTNPRIDLVYIDSTGTVAKVTGTAAASPSAPSVPANGISVCVVTVAANASVGVVVDSRGALARYQNTGIVSVKDFGAVGDGVTDDTAAIQAAIDSNPTETIYIPQGKYRLTNTITAKGSIQGAGASRNNATYNNGTWIIADFDDSSKDVIDISSAVNSFELSNITVEVNNARNGVYGDFSGNKLQYIHDVSVFEVTAGSGISVTSNMTRGCMLDNIVVFSSLQQTYENVGLNLQVHDVRLTNFEVMGCQVGVSLGVMAYLSNGHVWCGDISYNYATKTWWDNTIGVKIKDGASTYIYANNIYTDFCHTSFYGVAGATICVSNLFNYQSSSGLDLLTDTEDACIFECTNIIASNIEFIVSKKKYKMIRNEDSYYANNTQVKNVIMTLDGGFSLTNYLSKNYRDLVGTKIKDVEYLLSDNNVDASLRKIGTFYVDSGGFEVTVNCQALGIYKFVILCNGNSVTNKKMIYTLSNNNNCKFYIDATPDANKKINIYMKPPAATYVYAFISSSKTSGGNVVNFIDMNINNINGRFSKADWVHTGITTVDSSFSEITA